MKNCYYIHKSGLRFDAARMMSADEHESYDITLVVIELPGCADTPMEIIDWYFGSPTVSAIKRIADAWCAKRTYGELQDLLECQED